jgi:hypothetical protein
MDDDTCLVHGLDGTCLVHGLDAYLDEVMYMLGDASA